jgi:ribosomal protein L35AE/L33A
VESTSWELEEQSLIGIFNRGRHLSYQRGKRNTNPGTSLIKIEGVDDTNAAKYVQTANTTQRRANILSAST